MHLIRLVAFCLLISIYPNTNSFGQNLDWAISMGGSRLDNSHSVKMDSKGNTVTVGWQRGTADFDPSSSTFNLTSRGSQDIFIAKYDTSGGLLWAKGINGSGWRHVDEMVIDYEDNIIITGWIDATTDFDPSSRVKNVSNVGRWDAYLAKYSPNGALIWAFNMGSSGNDIGDGVCVDTNNNIYVTGGFSGLMDFDPSSNSATLNSRGNYDVFIAKYSRVGNYIWAKQLGGTGDDYGREIQIDKNKNLYLTGRFSGTANFNTATSGTQNLISKGGTDIFVVKLDSNGTTSWAKGIGSTSNDIGNSLKIDRNNNVFVTGNFQGTTDFNPGTGVNQLISKGGEDIFIEKLNTNGQYIWAKNIGGTSADYGASIAIDYLGNSFITGRFKGTTDFDPSTSVTNITSNGLNDFYVGIYDSTGNYVWAKGFGGSGEELGHSIHYNSGKILVSGYFSGTFDFDPSTNTTNRTSAGGTDVFVQKFTYCSSQTTTQKITSCDSSYKFPDGAIKTIPSKHTSKFKNQYGCDSIIITEVKPKTVNTTHNTKICSGDSLTLPDGKVITKAGVYTSILKIGFGCDSIITTNVSLNPIHSIHDTIRSCDSLYTYSDGKIKSVPSTHTVHLTNQSGCDSLIVTTVLPKSFTKTVLAKVCAGSSYTLPDGKLITAAGTYLTKVSSGPVCDSIITTILSLDSGQTTFTNVSFCEGDTFYFPDSTSTTIPMVHTSKLKSYVGCDSNIVTTAYFEIIDSTLSISKDTLIANEDSATYQWYDCGSNKLVGTARKYVPWKGGGYKVVITKNGCTKTSTCADIEIYNGISPLSNDYKMEVFPNPFSNFLKIESELELKEIRIYNSLGKLVIREFDSTGIINSESWRAGIYTILILTDKNIQSLKAIKY